MQPLQQGLKRLRPTAQNTTQLQQQLTERRPDGEDDGISRFLDEVDDVLVVHVGDVHSVHRHDAVPDVQLAAPLCGAALDDSTCNRQRATLAATAALTDRTLPEKDARDRQTRQQSIKTSEEQGQWH